MVKFLLIGIVAMLRRALLIVNSVRDTDFGFSALMFKKRLDCLGVTIKNTGEEVNLQDPIIRPPSALL